MIWAVMEEAPNVEIIDATFAISSDTTAGRDVMQGRALA
jgi:hypothetical protein